MAYIRRKCTTFIYNNLHIILIWSTLIVTSQSQASQPLKAFYEARLILDPTLGEPLLLECSYVTSRCYGSQQCSRTSSPVEDSIWFHNGIRLSLGVYQNQLHYDAAKRTDQGNYQCASKSSGGSLSESTRVYFTEPEIDPVETSITVKLTGSRWQHNDDTFSLNCAGAGANVKRVTWQYEGFNILSNHPLYTLSKVEQGMLQEKTIRSILSFRPIDTKMTCDDLEKFSGAFQCNVEYEVTKSAKENEPFVLENRAVKSSTEIRAEYEASNATSVSEPMFAFSPNILYLLCPLCVLNDVTVVTWSKEGKILQNSSSLSYMNRNADLTQSVVYSCESWGNKLDFLVNETFVQIKAEPEVEFLLVFWDKIEVTWRSNYDIPFRYVITMMYVSGSSVMYTNFFNKNTKANRVSTFLDVADEDVRFVAKTTVLDPFNKNQTLLETQHRQDIQTSVIAKEKPYINTIAVWENEGVVTFRMTKVDLEIVKCIKVNLTLTPESSRSRRAVSETEVKVTVGEDGILRADMTSLPPPWTITVPMTSSPTGSAVPLNLIGPFSPGERLLIEAVFFAPKSSGYPHVLSQARNTTVVASAPPPTDLTNAGANKSDFPWYSLVAVVALLVIIILVVAVLCNRRRKKKQGAPLDHGERFDTLDENNMYDILDYDQLTSLPDAPTLPPRPERQTDSWPLPTPSENTKKFKRPQSEMPVRQLSETEYLLPITQRSKSAGATPNSPTDDKYYLIMAQGKGSEDEGIGEDSAFIKQPQSELRRPSREERESGYLSMTSRDSVQQHINRRPQTHAGLPLNRNDSIPEQFEGPRRATVVPSRRELETMVDYEMKSELAPRDEYVSNDDLSDDTILTLPNDESYASQNASNDQSETQKQSPQNFSAPTSRNSTLKPKLSFRNSLIGRDSIHRRSVDSPESLERDDMPHPGSRPPSNVGQNDQTNPKKEDRLSNPAMAESNIILSPARLTEQLPKSRYDEPKQTKKDSKPKVKNRKKKPKTKKDTELGAKQSTAASKREKFTKHPSGTHADKSISVRVPDNLDDSSGVHSPHAKSFQKQFSYSPPNVQDQNTKKPDIYMSRTETFV